MSHRFSLIFLTVFLVACVASATTYMPMTDRALADQSQAVAAVRILSVDNAPGVSRPSTDYLVEIERLVAGYLPGTTLVVRVLGGKLPDGTGLHIWGAPRFQAQDRALLFLNPHDDGTFRITQFLLGAFRQVRVEDRVFAIRDLRGARALDGSEAELEVREWIRFVDWVADRRAGNERLRDYDLEPSSEELQSIHDEYSLFQDSGIKMRWFEFDNGSSVSWRSFSGGQPGVAGGGHSEFQTALGAWNADSGSKVNYRYSGTTSSQAGFKRADGVNAILFDDPGNEISDTFSCFTGGTLAIGGPWFGRTDTYQGTEYWVIAEGDIIINDGLECFFQDSSNASKAAAELFAHELGHTLGIGHSCGDTGLPGCSGALNDALMRPFVHDDGRGASLRSDDQAAVASLYPNNIIPSPNPPSMLTATLNGLAADLSWRDNSTDEDGFKVYRQIDEGSRSAIATLGMNVISYSDSTIETGHTYNYWVTAFSGRESAFSNVATIATDCDPPVAPSDLMAYPTSASALQISWDDLAEGETGFQVELMTGGSGSYEVVATLDANATALALDSLSSDTQFNVRVATMGAGSCLSSYAEARTWTPVDDNSLPAAPDQVLSILDDGFVTLTWRDNSDNELEFLVERRIVDPSSSFLFVTVATLPIDNSTATPSVQIENQTFGEEYEYRVRARGVGGHSSYSASATTEIPMAGGSCVPDPSTPCLLGDRFRVHVQWRDHHHDNVTGRPIAIGDLGDRTASLAFFNPEVVDVIVKVLDGRAISGDYWVFFGALSDVEYWVTVTDTELGSVVTYHNPPGEICGISDVNALPGAAVATTNGSTRPMTVVWLPVIGAQETGTCAADDQTLCLLDDRFQVRVTWEDEVGDQGIGVGTAIPETSKTGFFWFFKSDNTELAVKMLDATALNGRFWFFYGALSDVHYEITVTDTVGGTSKTYINDQGSFCGVGDTGAF